MSNFTENVELRDVQGLWSRLYLKSSNGGLDDTTWVQWLQSDHHHIDLRLLPSILDDESSGALSELTADQLLAQADNEGFGGTTTIVDSICTWKRHINYRGPVAAPDVGKLTWVDAPTVSTPFGKLLETGVTAEYEELWQRKECDPTRAFTFTENDGQSLILICSDSMFALARDRPTELDESKSLSVRLEELLSIGGSEPIAVLLDREYCFGTIEDGVGIVHNSSQPFRRGDIVIENMSRIRDSQTISVITKDFYGVERPVKFQSLIV